MLGDRSSKQRSSATPAGQDSAQASSNPAMRKDVPMVPPCDGKAKKAAIATRMSKAPVVWRAYRELLFDGVSWPNRCLAATLVRWVVDGVTRRVFHGRGPTKSGIPPTSASLGPLMEWNANVKVIRGERRSARAEIWVTRAMFDGEEFHKRALGFAAGWEAAEA
jgi:hypothetical protein